MRQDQYAKAAFVRGYIGGGRGWMMMKWVRAGGERKKREREQEDEIEKEIAGTNGEGKPCQTHVGQKC